MPKGVLKVSLEPLVTCLVVLDYRETLTHHVALVWAAALAHVDRIAAASRKGPRRDIQMLIQVVGRDQSDCESQQSGSEGSPHLRPLSSNFETSNGANGHLVVLYRPTGDGSVVSAAAPGDYDDADDCGETGASLSTGRAIASCLPN